MNDAVSFDEITEEFCKSNSNDIFERLAVNEFHYGRGISEDLMMEFVAYLTGAMVCKLMEGKPPKSYTKEQKYELANKTFARIKMKLQNAVSAGVQGGVETLTGKQVEYSCTIEPMPDTINDFRN